MKPGLLLTGATGFVGAELLPRWLAAHPEVVVHCLARAGDQSELARRRERVLAWGRVSPRDAARVVFHAGDLTLPDLGLGAAHRVLAREVGEVVHAAAATRFDLTPADAYRANVEGVEHVLAFGRAARRAGGLRRLHHVSTAFVEGAPAGDAPRFRNSYEASKAEAEQRVWRAAREGLPVTVYRPSIIVGDSRTGRTPHFRVLYEPMKWVYLGKTDVLPCRPEVRLDVVPIDWVCDAIVTLAARADSEGRSYLLCGGAERALSIGEIVEIAAASGNRRLRELGEPEVSPPRLVTPEQLAAATGAERAALERLWEAASGVLRAYAPYLLAEQLFDTKSLPPELALRCPPLREYLPALVRWAADTKYAEWAGLEPEGAAR